MSTSDKSALNSVMNRTWIVANPEHLGGKRRVRGTRISVAHLLEMFASGMTIPEIISAYPSLSQAAIKDVLGELAKEHDRQRLTP